MNTTSLLHSTRILIPVGRRTPPAFSVAHVVAQTLALFSVLIGALEVVAPVRLARQLGLRGKEPLPRTYGREITAGVAALAGFLGPAMWARIFSELRDVATLPPGRRTNRHTARNISIAVGVVAGIALIDLCVAALLSRRANR